MLSETTVRPRTSVRSKASMRRMGAPDRPNPPTITVDPDRMRRTASSAVFRMAATFSLSFLTRSRFDQFCLDLHFYILSVSLSTLYYKKVLQDIMIYFTSCAVHRTITR